MAKKDMPDIDALISDVNKMINDWESMFPKKSDASQKPPPQAVRQHKTTLNISAAPPLKKSVADDYEMPEFEFIPEGMLSTGSVVLSPEGEEQVKDELLLESEDIKLQGDDKLTIDTEAASKPSFVVTNSVQPEAVIAPAVKPEAVQPAVKPKKRVLATVFNLVFWLAVVAAVIALVFWGGGAEKRRTIFGFSAMQVLTTSMQSEIPKGALIVVRKVDTNTLQIKDDITYLREDNTTVTHRIVGIYENYGGTKQRGFETKGIENPLSDDEIVFADNVLGKVVWQFNGFEATINWVKTNWWVVALGVGGVIVAAAALKLLLKKDKPVNQTPNSV